MDYRQRAAEIARAYGLDPEIFVRQMETESGFNPRAVSPAGAGGIAQIMPATARQPGFGITPISDEARFDPEASMNFGAQYMRAMLDRYDGDYARALAAYNAGPRAVDRAGGVPNYSETQGYVSGIMGGGQASDQGGPMVFSSSRGEAAAEEPQGLLGALGIQRRDPEEGGETALPFYQRENFGRFMDALAVGLNELRDTPSQVIPAMVAQRQERRREEARTNATIEWLAGQPNGAPYVQMIDAGGSPADAIRAYMEDARRGLDAPTVQTILTPEGGEVAVQWDEQAGQWIPLVAPEGAIPSRPDLSESETKLVLFGNMQSTVMPIIDTLEETYDPSNIQDAAARALPVVGNVFQSDTGQQYEVAARAWAEGALRLQTGAAATQDEINRMMETYFARPGDSPNTIALKRQLRQAFTQNILGMGPAGAPQAPVIEPTGGADVNAQVLELEGLLGQ